MTPAEFKLEMESIELLYDADKEVAHIKADELMCKLLITLGYTKGVVVFDEMEKEYG